jgi:putative endonuclease
MERNALGRSGEAIAARYLERAGWTILDRNVRSRAGELDLIVLRRGVLAFVEVKTRRSRTFGAPVEAVTRLKAARVRRLAAAYLAERRVGARDVRFDVVDVLRDGAGFRVTHIEGAF